MGITTLCTYCNYKEHQDVNRPHHAGNCSKKIRAEVTAEAINKATTTLMTESNCFKRSKVAITTDYLAAIPIIGSLFGLARVIGSACVALYYARQNSDTSSIMQTRAKDECLRGLVEVIPFGGFMCMYVEPLSSESIKARAIGSYYCKRPDTGELWYGMKDFANKEVQWIKSGSSKQYTIVERQFGMAGTWHDNVTITYSAVKQARWKDNNPDEFPIELNVSVNAYSEELNKLYE